MAGLQKLDGCCGVLELDGISEEMPEDILRCSDDRFGTNYGFDEEFGTRNVEQTRDGVGVEVRRVHQEEQPREDHGAFAGRDESQQPEQRRRLGVDPEREGRRALAGRGVQEVPEGTGRGRRLLT